MQSERRRKKRTSPRRTLLVLRRSTFSERMPAKEQRQKRNPDYQSMELMETRKLPRPQPPAVAVMDASQRKRRQRKRQGRRKGRKRKRRHGRANVGTTAWTTTVARRFLGNLGRRHM